MAESAIGDTRNNDTKDNTVPNSEWSCVGEVVIVVASDCRSSSSLAQSRLDWNSGH